jgi:Coenzyme PQQ synthesis protein D (PqqD)
VGSAVGYGEGGPMGHPMDDHPANRAEDQVGAPIVGSVALGDRVAWLDLADRGEDALYASTLPDGRPLVLRGTAALIFLVAAEGGTIEEVVAGVAERAGQPMDAVRADVTSFVQQLLQLGLLARR